jgi:hypothetical protein
MRKRLISISVLKKKLIRTRWTFVTYQTGNSLPGPENKKCLHKFISPLNLSSTNLKEICRYEKE